MRSNSKISASSLPLEYFKHFPFNLANIYQQAVADLLANYHIGPDKNWQDFQNIENIFSNWLMELNQNPAPLWQSFYSFSEDYLNFYQHYIEALKKTPVTSYIEPAVDDKRFKDTAWLASPIFYFYEQFYLLIAKHTLKLVTNNSSKDAKLAKQIEFFTKQYLNALSPSNFVFTNPEILQYTLESNGENLIRGLKNFYEDILQGHGHWNMRMTDMHAFEIGKNLAVTNGKVIYQNALMQLIQYQPITSQVYEIPLLIVPPCINKYYVLDLSPKNSLVKWLVEQGYTVFMISWVNPDESYRNTTFADYVEQGIITALNFIHELTNQPINTLGFCIGGSLLASALGLLQAKHDETVKSATFLTTLIDFTEAGDLGTLIDEAQVANIEARMALEGYLDGRLLMMAFNFIRSNELLWSYFINNYLCGKNPLPFDLLFWNCDSTNLPEKMFSFYLRKLYLENELAQNKLRLNNTLINLATVKTPTYFLSTEQDHIAPWQSTFKGAQCLGGANTFVLAGSGHIGGVINPPANNKYHYFYGEGNDTLYPTPEAWLQSAKSAKGSWWTHWESWLKRHSGTKIAPPTPGCGKIQPLQEAPGDYVKKKIV